MDAIRAVSLVIDRGEFVALMGPSGSGKSTLMNTLGCLDRPTKGSYQLDEYEVATMTSDQRADLRNQKIGFVFQSFNLVVRTNAIENVELPLLYGHKLSARERRMRAVQMLERVGLGDRMHHHPGQLSGGQQQRVAIARALVNNPAILMADEPTGNLDSHTSKELMTLIRDLNEKGLTVILVTHDPSIARYAKRWIVLHDGRVVDDAQDFASAMQALKHEEGLT